MERAFAALIPAKPAPMTTTLGLLTCCVIGNIVAIPQPTYTAEGKSFRPLVDQAWSRRLPDCVCTGAVIRCRHLLDFDCYAWPQDSFATSEICILMICFELRWSARPLTFT